MSHIIQAVIWDMDGVIVDTGTYHFKSWHYVFKKQGINFTELDFQHIFGQRNDGIIKQYIGRDISQKEIDDIAQDKEENYRKLASGNLKPFPGVVKLLKSLKENGIKSAIASSAPLENIRLILKETGIEDYFQAIVYGREVSEGKPSPQIYLKAAEKLGVEPHNCVVIEDAVAGVQGARKANMLCLAVTNTHAREGLSGANMVVDSLSGMGLKDLNNLFTEK